MEGSIGGKLDFEENVEVCMVFFNYYYCSTHIN